MGRPLTACPGVGPDALLFVPVVCALPLVLILVRVTDKLLKVNRCLLLDSPLDCPLRRVRPSLVTRRLR